MHPIPIPIPIPLPIPPGTNITSSKSRHPLRPPSHMPSQPNSNAPDIDSNYESTHHYNPYPDPYANPSATASPTASATTQPCEFTTPCTTHLDTIPNSPSSSPEPLPTPSPPPRPARKLITHIFGRNKLSTRLFPPSVWVHYCRKHYQRARYRAPNWAVAQVDLVFVSLERMGVWGGVRVFEVVLRKRAMDLWADEGEEEGLEEGEGGDQDHEDDDDVDAGEMRRKRKRQTAVASRGQGKVGGRGIPKRKKPTIPKGSVPSWLREHLGPNKSFAEVRTMLEQLRTYLKEQERRRQGSSKATKKTQLRFPDIEILPVFKEWVGAGGRDEVAVEP
ncbi:putative pathogenicity factor [Aspergillus affinis]|uniref:putative pathogenicity factor n=1 Tax=Aspergillus affinis TaxID=1070780 RepID=UPI0022FF13F1|nr:uncharacterized protein KD926_009526 [Aspergillus affinis]KAI9039383.1 hypothetical protein KD926_009526 [Aspergillus affinis]